MLQGLVEGLISDSMSLTLLFFRLDFFFRLRYMFVLRVSL